MAKMLLHFLVLSSLIIGSFGRIGRAASTQFRISARSRARSGSSSSGSTGYSSASGSWTGPSYRSYSKEPAWDADGHNTITLIKTGRLEYNSYNISRLYKENPAGIKQYHGWTIPKTDDVKKAKIGHKLPGDIF